MTGQSFLRHMEGYKYSLPYLVNVLVGRVRVRREGDFFVVVLKSRDSANFGQKRRR